MNPRFRTYLQESFGFDDAQVDEVLEQMHRPLGKSIRVNTRSVALQQFKSDALSHNWTLTDTDVPEVFYIDREDTSEALGATEQHQEGQFYIQEVAAAHPPHILREHFSGDQDSVILDMCSSPGGKTTALAEFFPDSLIIANEADRSRLPQLYENLDRMGHKNICVTNYDGRYYQHMPEMFDAILLDAPCSGEGCAFKTPEALKNWHIKNIRRIAKLQYQLFLTAFHALKPGGTIVYSTCTLNKEENEGVIEKIMKKLEKEGIENGLELLDSKRFWPHETHTGGFFYAVFRKRSDITIEHLQDPIEAHNNILPATAEQKKEAAFDDENDFLYAFKKDRYICSHDLSGLMEKLYFTKVGKTHSV